jgi:hypothetical protein
VKAVSASIGNICALQCNGTADATAVNRDSEIDECWPRTSSIHALTLAELVPTHTPYCITLKPHLPKKTVQYLEWYHGAVSFLTALKGFLGVLNCEHQFSTPTIHDRFDLFTNLVLLLPPNEHIPCVTLGLRREQFVACTRSVAQGHVRKGRDEA